MTDSNNAKIKSQLKITKMHNMTKAGIILETQTRNKTIFKKRIPYLFFYYQFSLRLSPYANNVQLLIRF